MLDNAKMYARLREEQFSLFESYARKRGMNSKSLLVFMWIYYSPVSLTQEEIAKRTHSTKQVIQAIIKTYKEKGVLELLPSREDRRKKLAPLTVQSVRQKPPYMLIHFAEITGILEASRYRNQFVFVPVASLPPLPPGEYYFHQLIGLEAVDDSGARLGTLTDILETGANDVYVIDLEDGMRKLIADIPDNILKIDIDAGQIVIRIPEDY